jgi:phage portal protein BeeE
MGLFDKLFKKSFQSIGSAFGSAVGMSAPDIYAGRRAEAYRGWVFACVNAIAEDIASTELRLEQLNAEGKWEISKDQEPVRVLHAANPAMSGYDLLFSVAAYLLIEGNSYWFVAYNGLNKPAELWPLDPTKVTVTIKNGLVSTYRTMTANG